MIIRKLSPITRLDLVLSFLVALTSTVLYIRTLAPGLLYGDSGELQTVVYSLGMTHPTGYPVYVLLGHLFTLLPLGELAWRVNLFSAVLGAITTAEIYLIVRLLVGWRWAASFAAIVLAINPLFWFFSVITELYVPASAFLGGVLLFLLLWKQSSKQIWLAASALLGGLSLGVHSSVALAAPAVLVYLTLTTRSRKEWATAIGGALLGVALAFASFLTLDARNPDAGYYHAVVEPSMSVWNIAPDDFDSPLERLAFLYAARQFNYAMFSNPTETMPTIALAYLETLSNAFVPLSLALIVIGLVGMFFLRWQEALLLLLGWGVAMFFITNYAVFDVFVFFVPTFVFIVVWAGMGFGLLLALVSAGLKRMGQVKIETAVMVGMSLLLFVLTLYPWKETIFAAWQARAPVFVRGTLLDGYPLSLEDPQAAYREAEAIVTAVEPDAIVFLDWGLLFPCYFVANQIERPDMDFHETYPQEGVSEVSPSLTNYVAANIEQSRQVYFLNRPIGSETHRFDIKQVRKNGIFLYQVVGINP